MKRRITVPVFIPHQGCPHRCIFCDQFSISGHDSAPKPGQIDELVNRYTASAQFPPHIELAFFGGSFTGIAHNVQKAYLAEASRLKRENRISEIRLSTRPDLINEAVAGFLLEYGTDTVELGVQSFDNGVLSRAQRGHTAEDVIKAVSILKRYGLAFVIQLMPGLPSDTFEKTISSAESAVKLKPGGVRIYPACAFAQTQMGEMVLRGEYTPLSLDDAVEWCADLSEIFSRASIPILRTGLHPLDERGRANLVAGPYHPAFGFLVRSRLRRRELQKLIDTAPPQESYTIEVPEFHEEYIGFRRENIDYLSRTLNVNIRIQLNSAIASTRVCR